MRATSKSEKQLAKRGALADSVHRVLAAYIAHLGGKVVVSGPIQIQLWPGDGKFDFTVAVKCTGRKPTIKKTKQPNQELTGAKRPVE